MKHVFIIGSKGIPSKYSSFETVVDKLVKGNQRENIKYSISFLSDNYEKYEYKGARFFNIKIPNIGVTKAVYYDILMLRESIIYREND